MSEIAELYQIMSYGPAPESDAAVQAWLDAHGRQFDLVINDSAGDTPIVIFFQSDVASALGDSVIDNAADLGTAGMYQSSLNGQILSFRASGDGSFSDDQTDSTWNAFGEAVAGELAGQELTWVHAFPHFWFAWAAFHPETEVYGL